MGDSPLKIFIAMFSEPKAGFEAINRQSRGWLPALLVTVLSAAIFYWYFRTVDFHWLVEDMVKADASLDASQREAMRSHLSPGLMMWGAVAGSLIGLPICYALSAVYYLLAGKFLGSDKKFGQWFALAAWSYVPHLLVLALMAVQIATSQGRVSMLDLNMANLNFLLLHLGAANPWAGLASGLDPTLIWTLVLTVIGLRTWTGRGLGACLAVAALPYIAIYGIWAAKIILSH